SPGVEAREPADAGNGLVETGGGHRGSSMIDDRQSREWRKIVAFVKYLSAEHVVGGHSTQISTSPRLAAKIATRVTMASTFSQNELVLSPMMVRLLVMSTMSRKSGGAEKPWTMPA